MDFCSTSTTLRLMIRLRRRLPTCAPCCVPSYPLSWRRHCPSWQPSTRETCLAPWWVLWSVSFSFPFLIPILLITLTCHRYGFPSCHAIPPLAAQSTDMIALQNKKINVTGSGSDLGKSYIAFIRNNTDTIAKRVTDDLWILNVMEVSCRGGEMLEF